MEKEQLVILGNGFDLALGLATSYDDFFKWIKSEDTISTIPRLDSQSSSFLTTENIHKQILMDLMTKRINIWVYYFCQLDHTLKGWNNVESVIKNVIVTNNTIVPTMDTTISEYLQTSFYANDLLKKLLTTIYNVIPQNNKIEFSENMHIYELKNRETKFYPFLLDELNKFEALFQEYFKSEYYVSESPGKGNYAYLNLLSNMNINALDPNTNYHILDFNYTRLSYIEKNVRNIHGRLADNNIIFGIDATKIDSNTPYYQFTKESRIMHNSLESSLDKDILNKNIKEIKFFGHSLAEADYAYFQSIFDYLNIYDSDVILIFYYGSYLKVHKAELTEYEHQIQKLLSIYGTTLDNKDHGKNIMTKMMLENRLQIKHINSDY